MEEEMEMTIEDYNREYNLCLKHIIQYELKKNPGFLHPLVTLKTYLEDKLAHEKDHELMDIYLKNKNL